CARCGLRCLKVTIHQVLRKNGAPDVVYFISSRRSSKLCQTNQFQAAVFHLMNLTNASSTARKHPSPRPKRSQPRHSQTTTSGTPKRALVENNNQVSARVAMCGMLPAHAHADAFTIGGPGFRFRCVRSVI